MLASVYMKGKNNLCVKHLQSNSRFHNTSEATRLYKKSLGGLTFFNIRTGSLRSHLITILSCFLGGLGGDGGKPISEMHTDGRRDNRNLGYSDTGKCVFRVREITCLGACAQGSYPSDILRRTSP